MTQFNINGYSNKSIENATVYKVQSGDTLGKIASRYGKSVEDLAALNNIQNVNSIMAGQDLIIDYDAFTETPIENVASIPPVAPIQGTSYVIQPGETLNTISQKFGTSVEKIAQANGISNINLVYAGQGLIIPSSDVVNLAQPAPIQVEQVQPEPIVEQPVQNVEQASPIVEASIPVEVVQPAPVEAVAVAPAPTINLSANYTGILHSKRIASDASKSSNGVLTYNNQKYVVGGTTNISLGTISQRDYMFLVGQVAGEAGVGDDDALGVCSTILNRIETGGGFGNTVESALQKGYWPWGKTCDGFLNYDSNGNPSFKTPQQLGLNQSRLDRAQRTVADALNGVRNINSNTYYYGGDGTHNYFSDKV